MSNVCFLGGIQMLMHVILFANTFIDDHCHHVFQKNRCNELIQITIKYKNDYIIIIDLDSLLKKMFGKPYMAKRSEKFLLYSQSLMIFASKSFIYMDVNGTFQYFQYLLWFFVSLKLYQLSLIDKFVTLNFPVKGQGH